jgi:hypothetical protein
VEEFLSACPIQYQKGFLYIRWFWWKEIHHQTQVFAITNLLNSDPYAFRSFCSWPSS